MTAFRTEGASEVAINLLTDPDVVERVTRMLRAAGDTTAEALSMVGREAEWEHSMEFRCDPAGRAIAGMETAAIMDSHDQMSGTMMVGCRQDAVDYLANLLTSLDSGQALEVSERAQEATNIIGSAYLNGLSTALTAESGGPLGFEGRAFLPSPPRFVRGDPATMLELAVGGQGMGDRGWIADHRLRVGTSQIIVVWIPTSRAIVEMGAPRKFESHP